jgi:hypothetical protein
MRERISVADQRNSDVCFATPQEAMGPLRLTGTRMQPSRETSTNTRSEGTSGQHILLSLRKDEF